MERATSPLERDRALDRLRGLTRAAAWTSIGLAALFTALAAITQPGGVSAASAQNAASPDQGQGNLGDEGSAVLTPQQPSQAAPQPASGFPVAVSGGSH